MSEERLDETKINALTALLAGHHKIVFFGGAGVSTESGIPDFRSAHGIYSEKYHATLSPEEIVSHSFFVANPEEFYAFYFDKMIYPDVQPNDCHKALAFLEKTGHLTAIVTQNIDGLHQLAGSKKVYEVHGTVAHNHCLSCGKYASLSDILKTAPRVPRCPDCGGIIKPDVVLYEESLDDACVSGALQALSEADLLIVAGTSLVVYPAAGFIRAYRGRDIVMINKSATSFDRNATLHFSDAVGKVMKAAVLDHQEAFR